MGIDWTGGLHKKPTPYGTTEFACFMEEFKDLFVLCTTGAIVYTAMLENDYCKLAYALRMDRKKHAELVEWQVKADIKNYLL